jgi:hypothetical protein
VTAKPAVINVTRTAIKDIYFLGRSGDDVFILIGASECDLVGELAAELLDVIFEDEEFDVLEEIVFIYNVVF